MGKIYPLLIKIVVLASLCMASLGASAAPTITLKATSGPCLADGQITVTASGTTGQVYYAIRKIGVGSYSAQQVSNIFSNLEAGTYQVMVIDASGSYETATTAVLNVNVIPNSGYISLNVAAPSADNDGATGCGPDGRVILSAISNTGRPPYSFSLKDGPTVDPLGVVASNGRSATFTGLAQGTYTAVITDACNTSVSQAVTISTQFNLKDKTLSVFQFPPVSNDNYSSTGCDLTLSRSPSGLHLEDMGGTVLVPTSTGAKANGTMFPDAKSRIVYYSGSGTYYSEWSSSWYTFSIPASVYNPDETRYQLQFIHPCDPTNIVTSPEYNLRFPFLTREITCGYEIYRSFTGYNCTAVQINLTKTTSPFTTKTLTWDGSGTSMPLDLSGLSDGVYSVAISVNNRTYSLPVNTYNVVVSAAPNMPFNVRGAHFNYTVANGCDFETGGLEVYNIAAGNTDNITFTMISGPVSRPPVVTNKNSDLWSDLPAGKYTVEASMGCGTKRFVVDLTMPVAGFEVGELTYYPSENCGKYRLSGIAWYLRPDGTPLTAGNTYYYTFAILKNGVYVSTLLPGASWLSNKPFETLKKEYDPGTYEVRFASRDVTGTSCYYVSKFITLPEYTEVKVNINASGGVVCDDGSGQMRGNLHIATTGGSGNPLSFRIKPKGAPDGQYTLPQASSDFNNLLVGEYTVQVIDKCGTSTISVTQDVSLTPSAAVSSAGITGAFDVSGNTARVCQGNSVTLSLTVIGTATNFRWEKPDKTQIPGTSTYNINNFSPADEGEYVVLYNVGACARSDTMKLSMKPTPSLTSILTPPAICSKTAFIYTPVSSIAGSTFQWARAAVAGISEMAGSGTGGVNEVLTNTTSNPINVTYLYTTTYDGCTYTEPLTVTVRPLPSVSIQPLVNAIICAGTSVNLTAITANNTSIQWSRYNSTGTATGETTNTLHYTSRQRASDTTLYIWANAVGECGVVSDSIRITVKGNSTASFSNLSSATICAGSSVTYTLNTTNTGYFEWIGGSGTLLPTRQSTSVNYVADQINFSYTPAASEKGTTVELVLRSTGGSCGYRHDTLRIDVLPQTTEMKFAITKQPHGLQTICTDTVYEIKAKAVGVGGLKNIRVGLFDENITNIQVNSAQYQYPYNSGTWQSLGSYTLVDKHYKYQLPPLPGDDSVLVRINVRAGCNFSSGDIMRFTLEATDLCNVPLGTKDISSQPYTLRGDPTVANQYVFNNTIAPLTTNSQSGDTILHQMELIITGSQPTDSIREKIVMFLPTGFTVDPTSLIRIKNASGSLRAVPVSGGIEYHFVIPSGIIPQDTIRYEFKTSTKGAPCGKHILRNQVYYSYSATCDAVDCSVSSIRANEETNISVERYAFTLAGVIQGGTNQGMWGGDIQLNAINGLLASDSIKVEFYIDRDKNNRHSAGDALVSTKYVKSLVNIAHGGILPLRFSNIPVETGLQLIAYSTDPLLCSTLQFPVTIITGLDTTCQNTVTIFEAAEGMVNYSVDAISGATRVPITTVADYPKQNKIQVKWTSAVGNIELKGKYSRVIGNDTIPSEKTTFRIHVSPPVSLSGLKTEGNTTTFCSPGTAKIYAGDLKNVSSVLWKASTAAGTLSGQTTDTIIYSLYSRNDDTALWVSFTGRGLGTCADVKDSIQLTIYATIQQGAPVGGTICYGSDFIFAFPDAAGGHNNTYQWQDSIAGNQWQNARSGTDANAAGYTTPVMNETTWYRRIVTGSCGQTDTSTIAEVIVLPEFDIRNIPVITPVCEGTPVTVRFEVSGGEAPYSYSLDDVSYIPVAAVDSITQSGNMAMHFTAILAEGEHIFYLAENSGCGFIASSYFSVDTHPLPTVDINGSDNACTGDRMIYDATTGMTSYQWEILTGGVIDSNNGNIVTIQWGTASTMAVHRLALTVTNSNGCINTIEKPVTVNLKPSESIIYRQPN